MTDWLRCESLSANVVSSYDEVLPVALTQSRSHSQPSSPQLSVHSVYTIATRSFEISASIISGRVYPEQRLHCIDSSHWGRGVDINWVSVIGHWLLSASQSQSQHTIHKSNTCRMLSNKSGNRSCLFIHFQTRHLAVLDLLSPLGEYDKCWKPLSQFPPRRI